MRNVLVPFAALLLAACPGADRARDAGGDSAAAAPVAGQRDTVVFETSRGNIVMEVEPLRAPETVANFLKHVRAHFYDGLIFHRIEPTFVIQAGAVTETAGERTSTVFPVGN